MCVHIFHACISSSSAPIAHVYVSGVSRTALHRVSEAILDDILEELSAEMMAAGDRMAEELFSKEFARPDTPNDVSSSTHSSMPSVVCTTD